MVNNETATHYLLMSFVDDSQAIDEGLLIFLVCLLVLIIFVLIVNMHYHYALSLWSPSYPNANIIAIILCW